MNLLHLNYFYVVAKEGGFLKASKLLRIQQPAISRMVGQLEENLGFELFEKIGRNVRLTSQGVEVFDRCKRIFSEVENLELSVGTINGECRGPLNIVTADGIASHFIPGALESFLKNQPKVYPSLFSGPASMLLEKIEKGEAEMGMFFHVPELTDRLEVYHRFPLRFYLVVKKELRKDEKALASFIGSRELDDLSNKKFPTLDRLRKDHKQAKISISCNNLGAHLNLVKLGMGVSILPEFLVKEDLKNGILADVYPQEKFVFDMLFIKRRTGVLSLNASEFMKNCHS